MAQQFGIIGLGVMGQNLARNVARNGFRVAAHDLSPEKAQALRQAKSPEMDIQTFSTLEGFALALERPRKILIMVNAGAPVDSVIGAITPHLQEGDILIDGGNSLFRDTDRRIASLAGTGVRYIGMGVSGGEEGALWGPSMMPGGDRDAYDAIQPILTRIGAQTDSGPCVDFMGKGSAGHFVKMCHNGIEYGDMQLIAEAYDLLRNGLGLSLDEITEIFVEWNRGELQSFLIELTSQVVNYPDDQDTGDCLLNRILDSAGQKGTGKWTSQTALDLGVPLPTITASVDARFLSAMKNERVEASKEYGSTRKMDTGDIQGAVNHIRAALYASKICSYTQGFALLRAASHEFGYDLNYESIARVWKGGCIIRAVFLDRIRQAYSEQPELSNLLMAPGFVSDIGSRIESWRWTAIFALQTGMAIPAISASLAYFDSFRAAQSPANLLQALRDNFGAHTYRRTDREGTFHTNWKK